MIRNDGNRAVVLGPCYSAQIVLASEQASLPVAGIAIGVIRGLPEHAHPTGLFIPAHHPVVRDIAPEQVTAIAEPDWPFGPTHAGGDFLDFRQRELVLNEG